MSALILFRSLTFAQRGSRFLAANGIPSTVIKAPMGVSDRGCAHAVSLQEGRLRRALSLLEENGIPHGKALLREPDGGYREVGI